MSEEYKIVTDKELQDDERISAYLRGRMTAEEETAFMDELKIDDGLRSQAISTAHLAKAMKEIGEENDEKVKEALTSISETAAKYFASRAWFFHKHELDYYALTLEDLRAEARAELKAESSKSSMASAKRKRMVKLISIAACLFVLVGVGFKYYNYRTVTKLGNEYCSVFVSEQTPSRGIENADVAKELQTLYTNVQEGKDLDMTIKRLSILWEVSKMKTYNDYTNEAAYIGWNLAIAYLKDDDKESAIEVLETLASNADTTSIVMAKAKELLNKIN